MKKVCLLLAICVASCGGSADDRPVGLPTNNVPTTLDGPDMSKDGPTLFVVGNFTLRASPSQGRCVLQYRSKYEGSWQEYEMGMESPCDFVGRNIKTDPPQRYMFGSGNERVTILMMTGGPPHPRFNDEFMPAGCGTRLAKVRVYSDRVEVETASPSQPSSEPDAICPSKTLDEVIFATG